MLRSALTTFDKYPTFYSDHTTWFDALFRKSESTSWSYLWMVISYV